MRATTIYTKGDIKRLRVMRQRMMCRLAELELERERTLWKLELVRDQIDANKIYGTTEAFDPSI